MLGTPWLLPQPLASPLLKGEGGWVELAKAVPATGAGWGILLQALILDLSPAPCPTQPVSPSFLGCVPLGRKETTPAWAKDSRALLV